MSQSLSESFLESYSDYDVELFTKRKSPPHPTYQKSRISKEPSGYMDVQLRAFNPPQKVIPGRSDFLNQICKKAKNQIEQRIRLERRSLKIDKLIFNEQDRVTSIEKMDLFNRMYNFALNDCFDNLSDLQLEIINNGFAATLPHFLKSDYDALGPIIKKEKNISVKSSFVMIMASRRAGKTSAIAILCACLLYFIPGFQIALFSLKKKSAQDVLINVKAILRHLGVSKKEIVVDNTNAVGIMRNDLLSKMFVESGQPRSVS